VLLAYCTVLHASHPCSQSFFCGQSKGAPLHSLCPCLLVAAPLLSCCSEQGYPLRPELVESAYFLYKVHRWYTTGRGSTSWMFTTGIGKICWVHHWCTTGTPLGEAAPPGYTAGTSWARDHMLGTPRQTAGRWSTSRVPPGVPLRSPRVQHCRYTTGCPCASFCCSFPCAGHGGCVGTRTWGSA